jgi:hypothetical protein
MGGPRKASQLRFIEGGSMTKDEIDYSRKLMDETNSILAGLDNTKIHDAVNWGDLSCHAVEKVETFAGNAIVVVSRAGEPYRRWPR